jgi:hypothetical protein
MGHTARNLDSETRIHHTRILWQLIRHSSPRRQTHSRWTTGSAPLSQRLISSMVQSSRKLCTPHSNIEALLEPSGPPTLPHYPLIIMSHGVSSALSSMVVTYPQVFYAARQRSSLTWNKGTILCTTTTDSTTTSVIMGLITLTRMKRKPSSSTKGSLSSCRTV